MSYENLRIKKLIQATNQPVEPMKSENKWWKLSYTCSTKHSLNEPLSAFLKKNTNLEMV